MSVGIVNGLAGGLGGRSHQDDDILGILGAIVREELILAACALGNGGHVLLHNSGNGVVIAVAGLAVGEECLGVLGHALGLWMLGREGTCAELAQGLLVHQVAHVIILQEFHLLVLVRGTEAVEEVDKGDAALDGSQVSDRAQVHDLLYRALAQHGEARLAAGHHIAVVTEDTQRVRGHRARRHMKHTGKQFARNLVHVGDHQQQALAGCECRGERTGLQ